MFLKYLLYFVLPIIHLSFASFKCPSLFNFYPDVHDCSKFYRCIWGKGATFNCPSGTLWSQDLLTCNHAKEVKCDKPSVSDEMKDFEAPDFSVDIKKSKTSHDGYEDDSVDDGEDENTTDNWSGEKKESYKSHKPRKDESYYHNYDTDYGEVSGYESKGKKDKYSHQKLTSGHYSPTPQSQDYHHVINHNPQPHHFVHHFQPTPFLLSLPEQYKSGSMLSQQYLSRPMPQHYQSGPLTQQYPSGPLLQQYHTGPLQHQYHSGIAPLSPPPGYILAPQKYVFQPSKQTEGEKPPGGIKPEGKIPQWYNSNYLYNKLVQVPQLGQHYYSPYVVNTDGTYDVLKVDVPLQETEKTKGLHKLEPQMEKPPAEEDPWKETDLFRAGYGYKLIYHK